MRIVWLQRALLISAVVFGLTVAPAAAQFATIDELRGQLARGDRVSIRSNGSTIDGQVVRLGDSDLEMDRQNNRRLRVTIPFNAIQSLERRADSTGDGAAWGAGIAAAAMGGLFIYAWRIDANEMDEWAPIYLRTGAVLTGVGALIGWMVDASRSKPYVRYVAPTAQTRKVQVLPLMSEGRGVAVSVSF